MGDWYTYHLRRTLILSRMDMSQLELCSHLSIYLHSIRFKDSPLACCIFHSFNNLFDMNQGKPNTTHTCSPALRRRRMAWWWWWQWWWWFCETCTSFRIPWGALCLFFCSSPTFVKNSFCCRTPPASRRGICNVPMMVMMPGKSRRRRREWWWRWCRLVLKIQFNLSHRWEDSHVDPFIAERSKISFFLFMHSRRLCFRSSPQPPLLIYRFCEIISKFAYSRFRELIVSRKQIDCSSAIHQASSGNERWRSNATRCMFSFTLVVIAWIGAKPWISHSVIQAQNLWEGGYLVIPIGFGQDHKLGRCLAASFYDETSSLAKYWKGEVEREYSTNDEPRS